MRVCCSFDDMEEFSAGSLVWRVMTVFVLVAANAFFVAAEFAIVASRRTRLAQLAEQGDRKAKLAQLVVQSRDRYISGTQLGITLSSIGLGWIGEPAVASLVERLFRGLPAPIDVIATHSLAVAIAFAFITFLHIVLGELAPKTIALLHPEAVSRWVAAPLIGFTTVTSPFIWVLNGSANAFLNLLGARAPTEAERVHQPEEIVMLVRQSQLSGQMNKQDVRMIEGVFEFTEKTARDVMTPRTAITALPADCTVAQAADHVADAGRSRYPVYGESLDDITGVLHAKTILAALRTGNADALVGTIARPAFFVPGAREVEDVLADMKRLKTQLAVVLDEFGGTAGIVTMEDLLEEIVGQIYDEYDAGEPAPQTADGGVTFKGAMEIADANRRFTLGLPGDEYQTVGGWVFGRLGRLPRTGDRVELEHGALEVMAMQGKRVGELKWIAKRAAD